MSREKKYTFGKWEAREWDGDEWPEKRISIGPPGIAVMISPRYATETAIYDAQLAASAPDLLEALEELLLNSLPGFTTEEMSLIQKSERALAKAYGDG